MESLEMRGKTVEEAVQRALHQLGVSRDEVEVNVIREGKSGILGIGAEEAIIQVTPIPKPKGDAAEVAREIVEHLLQLLGVTATIESQVLPVVAEEKEAAPAVALNIKGDDLGILIGRRGQTLAALQYIVRLLVGQQVKSWVPIVIDVEGYKQRRYQALESFARQMAERVKTKGAPFTLEPMPAYERRIVHMALANHADVITESIGQGETRKVVIRPKNK
ncbi:MAG TPA: RNA-binding cell elongation regulator Jag/EloR [Dehalococcoidales bacterium]|jgi:spoIIIJ-associated protein